MSDVRIKSLDPKERLYEPVDCKHLYATADVPVNQVRVGRLTDGRVRLRFQCQRGQGQILEFLPEEAQEMLEQLREALGGSPEPQFAPPALVVPNSPQPTVPWWEIEPVPWDKDGTGSPLPKPDYYFTNCSSGGDE